MKKRTNTPKPAQPPFAPSLSPILSLLAQLDIFDSDDIRQALPVARRLLTNISKDEAVDRHAGFVTDWAARSGYAHVETYFGADAFTGIETPGGNIDHGDILNAYMTPACAFGVALCYVALVESAHPDVQACETWARDMGKVATKLVPR